MATSLSKDLRLRVIRAVEGGMSRNAAARRFGVSIASAVRWMSDYLGTGRTAPRPQGGDRRSGRIDNLNIRLSQHCDRDHGRGVDIQPDNITVPDRPGIQLVAGAGLGSGEYNAGALAVIDDGSGG